MHVEQLGVGAEFAEPAGSVHGERANFGGLVLGCIDSYDSERERERSNILRETPLASTFFQIFQDLQYVHPFAPL